MVDAPAVSVCVDEVRLRQALDDLLDNATRYTAPGGTVRVAGAVDGRAIRLSVDDDGPGFSDDVLSRAFEPFVGSDDGDRADRGGSGLGLAIVRVIAEAHGGQARAENRPDGGARVTMTIAGPRLTGRFIAPSCPMSTSWAHIERREKEMMKRITAALGAATFIVGAVAWTATARGSGAARRPGPRDARHGDPVLDARPVAVRERDRQPVLPAAGRQDPRLPWRAGTARRRWTGSR